MAVLGVPSPKWRQKRRARELGEVGDGAHCVLVKWIWGTGLARVIHIPHRSGVVGRSLQLWSEASRQASLRGSWRALGRGPGTLGLGVEKIFHGVLPFSSFRMRSWWWYKLGRSRAYGNTKVLQLLAELLC